MRSLVDELRDDMIRLANLLRADTEGAPLSASQRKALAALAADPATAVASRYGELLIEGELLGSTRTRVKDLRLTREALTARCTSLLDRLADDSKADLLNGGGRPDKLHVRVLRHIDAESFDKALRSILKKRGLRRDAIEMPKERFWTWLASGEEDTTFDEGLLPSEVRRCLLLDDDDFLEMILLDANSPRRNESMMHPVLAERWVSHADEVERRLGEARRYALDDYKEQSVLSSAGRKVQQLHAIRAYARGCARILAARLLLGDLKLRVAEFYQKPALWSLRVTCLNQAFAKVKRAKPQLATAVVAACTDHRAICCGGNGTCRCLDCVPTVADDVVHRLAGATEAKLVDALLSRDRAVEAEAGGICHEFSSDEIPLVSPAEEDDAWWTPAGDGTASCGSQLVWSAVLRRLHILGQWCALPPGELSGVRDGQRLWLRLEHKDPEHPVAEEPREVVLRRRGSDWELHGIRWPDGIRPGTVISLRWPTGGDLVDARTTLLPAPELVDGVEYLHRYDPQVLTREGAPGWEQDRDVPDLSDAAWVLRTLRTLGYLSPDGTATLAEDTLRRHCLEAGMPDRRVASLDEVVKDLVRSGRLKRVRGGIDHHGRPWCPARTGDLSVDLLRYVPKLETGDPAATRAAREAWQALRRGHWVAGFLRRLQPGATASAEQVELYHQDVDAARVVAQRLPQGYTYVRRHRRGRR